MKKEKMPLMKRDWHIVEHWKWYFAISAIIMVLGLILTFTIGPKFGIDFKSGFVLQVEYSGNQLTAQNQQAKASELTKLLEGTKDSEGISYGIRVSDTRFQGDTDQRTIRLVYQSSILNKLAEDEDVFEDTLESIRQQVYNAVMDEQNPYLINVSSGGRTSPTMSSELLLTAITAIIAACVFMLLYVMFRFELASGFAAIVALAHDIAIMFFFMVIFQVEINSTFIAAVVAILGYSINNTLVVFDRVRENLKKTSEKQLKVPSLVNSSLKETFRRSVNTTVTTIFAMVMLAVLGVTSIRIFAFPIIIGILTGAYSSFCIAPSIFTLVKTAGIKRTRAKAKERLKHRVNKEADK